MNLFSDIRELVIAALTDLAAQGTLPAGRGCEGVSLVQDPERLAHQLRTAVEPRPSARFGRHRRTARVHRFASRVQDTVLDASGSMPTRKMEVARSAVRVLLEALADLKPTHIVVSPGTGTPEKDSGISNDVIRILGQHTPILGVCLGQQRKNYYNALLYKKHPHLYSRWVGRLTPWDYYQAVGAALVALGALLAGRRRLALAAGLVWALLTGRFFARRLRGTSRRPGHVLEMVVTSPLIPFLSVYWRLRGAIKYRVHFL